MNLPAALIPAYKPSEEVVNIAVSIIESGVFSAVYCVDDGSGPSYRRIFESLEEKGVRVLRHAVNMGKGMAIRTGMNVILANIPDISGVVTLDADGQHLAPDVIETGRALHKEPDTLVLGCRSFGGKDIPLRSRLGNIITRWVFTVVSGMKITDTQTGLRGIPAKLIPALLRLKTTGYDFELDMLVCAREEYVPFKEIPIATVYENENSCSSFNPLTDSLRIYFVFLRYLWVGLLSFAVDFTMFMTLFNFMALPVTWANVCARGVSSTFNFLLNRKIVFKSRGNILKEYVKYFILMIYIITINTSVVYFTYNYVTKFAASVKLTAEIITFFVTFMVSRSFVFKDRIR